MTKSIANLIDRLEEIREEQNIPKKDFGPRVGVTFSAYRKWTYGKVKPSGDNVLKIQTYIEEYENKN